MTLLQHQSHLGQIPDAYWPERSYWDWGETGCTDASAWVLTLAGDYVRVTGDLGFAAETWPSLQKTFTWLCYQDANNTGLLDSPEGGDWMDSTFNRSGKVFYVNCLFYAASLAMREISKRLNQPFSFDIAALQQRLHTLFWPTTQTHLSDLLRGVKYPPDADVQVPHTTMAAAYDAARLDGRRYFLASVSYGRFLDRCDVLANLAAIVFGLADEHQTEGILDYLSEHQADVPYPTRCWTESEVPASEPFGMFKHDLEGFQDPRWRNAPGEYHNGAVWPFIGGLHVVALKKGGREQEAGRMLERLAEANLVASDDDDRGFHEWLRKEDGSPGGAPDQTWNAGTFVLAHEVCQQEQTPLARD